MRLEGLFQVIANFKERQGGGAKVNSTGHQYGQKGEKKGSTVMAALVLRPGRQTM